MADSLGLLLSGHFLVRPSRSSAWGHRCHSLRFFHLTMLIALTMIEAVPIKAVMAAMVSGNQFFLIQQTLGCCSSFSLSIPLGVIPRA